MHYFLKWMPCCLLVASTAASAGMSTTEILLKADLSALVPLIQAEIPQTIDEKMVPKGMNLEGLRWHLKPAGPVRIEVTSGLLKASVRYYGDAQLIKVISICHLGDGPGVYTPNKNWFYVDALISARPSLSQAGGDWMIGAADVKARVSIPPESDTRCSFARLDFRGKIEEALKNTGVENKIQMAIQSARIVLPIMQVMAQLAGPIQAGSVLQSKICVYPGIRKLKVGTLDGSMNAVTIPVHVTADPTVEFVSTDCPVRAAPRPIIE